MSAPRAARSARAGRIAIAAALLATVACAPLRQTIVFWQFWPAAVIDPLIARFEKENPGRKVTMERLTWQEGFGRITAAESSGEVPDLCEVGSTYMPKLLASGKLADWSAGVGDLKPSIRGWELCSIGDVSYGMPWVLGTRALFYNKALFARAGLDSSRAPETWDDLREAAAAIDRLGNGVHGFGVQGAERSVLFKKFMPFAWGNGGHVLTDDLRAPDFNTPRNVEALAFYLGLRQVGVVGKQETLDRAFREGRLGLEISGAWLFPSIARDAPSLRYGVALVPRPEQERGFHASFAGGEVLVSFTASKRKRAALELARFLVRPDNVLALVAGARNVQPATADAETTGYYRARPNEALMIRQFDTAVPTPNHPAWVEMEAVIEDEVQQALEDRKSASQAVADAQQKLAALVARKE